MESAIFDGEAVAGGLELLPWSASAFANPPQQDHPGPQDHEDGKSQEGMLTNGNDGTEDDHEDQFQYNHGHISFLPFDLTIGERLTLVCWGAV